MLVIGFLKPDHKNRVQKYRRARDDDPHLQWLAASNIPFQPCGGVASENAIMSYPGLYYIDVPMNENHPTYRQLLAYFENEDGTPKDPLCVLYAYTLENAMKNAHHDEPGFWDKKIEDFWGD